LRDHCQVCMCFCSVISHVIKLFIVISDYLNTFPIFAELFHILSSDIYAHIIIICLD